MRDDSHWAELWLYDIGGSLDGVVNVEVVELGAEN
jgi:hypothetical protein